MLLDIVNDLIVVNGLAAASYAATSQGASQDFSNANIQLGAIINVGAFSGTTATVQIEESTTGTGAWSVIPGMVQTFTNGTHCYVLKGQRSNRYVRANLNTASVTSVLLAVELLEQRRYGVVANQSGASISPAGA